jgi:hypothetical protein
MHGKVSILQLADKVLYNNEMFEMFAQYCDNVLHNLRQASDGAGRYSILVYIAQGLTEASLSEVPTSLELDLRPAAGSWLFAAGRYGMQASRR